MVEITPEYLAKSGTEDGEQAALFCYAVTAGRTDPLWNLLYAIPNGGKREAATAARLKATGVKAGFPDIGLPVARGGYHALYIELKRRQVMGKRGRMIGGGTTQTDQEKWHADLSKEDNCVQVCYGWEDAVNCVLWYLDTRFVLFKG